MLKVGSKSVVATLSLVCLSLTLLSGVLLSAPSSSADNDSHIDDVSIIVPISCNLIGTNTTHSKTINPGTTEEDIGKTTLKAFCNDNNGFAIYAIGYTNDTDGTTTLIGGTTNLTIATNTNTSGSSSWSMKLTKETNASNAYNPSSMTINNGYDSYSVVPTNWTKVATFSSATDSTLGAVLYTTYKVHIAPGQAADTYSGKVKYTLFHPNNSCLYYTIHFDPGTGSGAMEDQPICRNTSTALSTNTLSPPTGGYEFKEWNTEPDGTGTSYSNAQIINTNLADVGETVTLYAIWGRSLYGAVANLSKGTLAQNNVALTDEITTPTSTNKDQDTSNSGVYTYDPAVYGTASDANNDYPIYFYRGILETNPGTYGATGSANAYPNYVKLGNNTCWRILRTTGSGGIKMIYSGTYGASTSGSCATNRPDIDSNPSLIQFNTISDNNKHAVGYTYNSNMNSVTTNTSVDTVFGNDANPALNNTKSTVKSLAESWYANNMTSYTNILEPNAGYCNDRTIYGDDSENPNLVTMVVPYQDGYSAPSFYFGVIKGDNFQNKNVSLYCPRGTVDLYRYVPNSNGLGNELAYPAALITRDELYLAGGNVSRGFFLNSGSYGSGGGGGLSTMTPTIIWVGRARVSTYYDDGDNYGLRNQYTNSYKWYVRPVISLIHSTTIASGSGTATNPWLIDE